MKLLEENTIWNAETIASYYFLKDIERIAFVHICLRISETHLNLMHSKNDTCSTVLLNHEFQFPLRLFDK